MRKSESRSPLRRGVPRILGASLLMAALLVPLATAADGDPSKEQFDGDVSARTFEAYCRGDLPSNRRSKFFSALDAAERALASGDQKTARGAFSEARSAAYRGGGDSDLSVKCLGQSTARRWFKGQLELNRLQSRVDSHGRQDETAALYVTAIERGAPATISLVEGKRPRDFVAAVHTLEQIADAFDRERRFGAFLLSEEEALAETCRRALTSLRERAAQEHRRALKTEREYFDRPISDRERAATDAAGNVQGLAMAFTGVDVGGTLDRDTLVLDKRATESRDFLRRARTFNLRRYDDRRAMPSSKRALERGDAMLSRAEDAKSSLPLRDALYDEAQRYYDFGGFKEESAAAAAAHKAIQPALQAARDQQEKLLDEADARLKGQAESAREAAEKLKKSASEQKQFKEEADALEAELGF
jgi:hypothetical protein